MWYTRMLKTGRTSHITYIEVLQIIGIKEATIMTTGKKVVCFMPATYRETHYDTLLTTTEGRLEGKRGKMYNTTDMGR